MLEPKPPGGLTGRGRPGQPLFDHLHGAGTQSRTRREADLCRGPAHVSSVLSAAAGAPPCG